MAQAPQHTGIRQPPREVLIRGVLIDRGDDDSAGAANEGKTCEYNGKVYSPGSVVLQDDGKLHTCTVFGDWDAGRTPDPPPRRDPGQGTAADGL